MALDDTIRQLSEIAILRHLERDALRLLAFSAETRLMRAGDVLFSEGEPSDGGFIVMVGVVELQAAHDPSPLRIASPALLGEAALFTETTRPATATAVTHATAMRVTRALFRRVLDEFPESAVRMHRVLVGRLTDYTDDLARFANGSS